MTADRPAQRAAIRVLTANVPALLLEVLLPVLQSQPDIVLLGNVQPGLETLLAAAMRQADVLILGAARTKPAPGICSHLLGECPDLKILVLSFSGQAGRVYWLGVRGRQLRSVSAASVMAAVRGSRDLC